MLHKVAQSHSKQFQFSRHRLKVVTKDESGRSQRVVAVILQGVREAFCFGHHGDLDRWNERSFAKPEPNVQVISFSSARCGCGTRIVGNFSQEGETLSTVLW